jgi:hypothetical protein
MSLSDAELRYLRKVDRESEGSDFYVNRTDKGVIRSVHVTNLLSMGYLSWSSIRNRVVISDSGRAALQAAGTKGKASQKNPNLPAAELRYLRKAYKDAGQGDIAIKRFDNGVIRSTLVMSLLQLGYVAWSSDSSMAITDKGLLALGKPARAVKVKVDKVRVLDDDVCTVPDFGPRHETKAEADKRLDDAFIPVAFETRRGV